MRSVHPSNVIPRPRKRWAAGLRLALVVLLFGPAPGAAGQDPQGGPLLRGVTSPTAASLGKFGDVPVGLFTGTPSVSVPLYEVRGRTLALPIKLDYHASGVKVEELSGWVGLGWALDAGGVITRSVRAVRDDDPDGYYETGHRLEALRGDPYLTTPGWRTYLEDVADGLADPEPDRFSYNFAGRSGQFVFSKNAAGQVAEIRTVPHSKLRIAPASWGTIDLATTDDDYGITGWTITDEQGTRYLFTAMELTGETGTSIPNEYVSAWYLTRITSADGDDTIEIGYASPHAVSYKMRLFREQNYPLDQQCFNLQQFPAMSKTVRTQVRTLRSITTAYESVWFETVPLSDASGAVRLDRIVVRARAAVPASGAAKRQFVLRYDEYPRTSGSRLFLKQVQELDGSGGAAVPAFAFTYEAPAAFPDRLEGSSMDHWGFFNGASNNAGLLPDVVYQSHRFAGDGANREPSFALMDTGILTRIDYPTGGHTVFTYEPHDYSTAGTSQGPVYEMHQQTRTVVASGRPTDPGSTLPLTSDGGAPVSVRIQARVYQHPLDPGGTCTGGTSNMCGEAILYDPGGAVLRRFPLLQPGSPFDDYDVTLQLAPATYTLRISSTRQYTTEATATWSNQVQLPKAQGGGLRIRQIASYASPSAEPFVRTYDYVPADQPGRSSGVLYHLPRYHYVAYRPYVDGQLFDCTYLSISAWSHAPLVGAQGSPVGYGRVVVSHGPGGSGGRTVHTFTVNHGRPAVPDGETAAALFPSGNHTNDYWRDGESLTVEDQRTDGGLVRRVRRTLRFADLTPRAQDPSDLTRRYAALDVKHTRLQHHDLGNPPGQGWSATAHYVRWYDVISSWSYPESEMTMTYGAAGASGPAVDVATTYGYDLAYLQLRSKTESHAGRQRTTEYRYAHEQYPDMRTRNMLAQPGSTAVSDGASLVRKQWTCWGTWTGDWHPRSEWAWAGDGSPGSTSPCSVTDLSRLPLAHVASGGQLVNAFDTYDAYGRVRAQRDARGFETTYTYGHPANDPEGVLLSVVSKGGLTERYDYYPPGAQWGLLQRTWDLNGQPTVYAYDALGRLASVTGPAGLLASYAYHHSSGNPAVDPGYVETTTHRESGHVTRREYFDGLGRPVQVQVSETDGKHVVTTTEYDALGRPLRVWNPLRASTGGAFLPLGPAFTTSVENAYRLANCTSPVSYTTTFYAPDPLSRTASVTPPHCRNGLSPRKVVHAYDASGTNAVVRTTDENQIVTTTTTDGWGNQVAVTTGNGMATTQFNYDLLGRLHRVLDPAGRPTHYRYNSLGQLVARTTPDADGNGTGGPADETGVGASVDFEYVYDASGNLRFTLDPRRAEVQPGMWKKQYTYHKYDAFGRVTESGVYTGDLPAQLTDGAPTASTHSVVRYTYDAVQQAPHPLRHTAGRLASVVFPGGSRHYSYDAAGRIETIYISLTGLEAEKRVDYAYDRPGSVTKVSYQPGEQDAFFTWYRYDQAGRLARIYTSPIDLNDDQVEAAATLEASYQYQPTGQVMQLALGASDEAKPVQIIDYAYGIRGWLTRINDVAQLAQSGSLAPDRFAQHLGYDQTLDAPPDAVAQYNGNVAWVTWRTEGVTRVGLDLPGTSHPVVGYTFRYDPLNRLVAANFSKYNNAWRRDQVYDVGLGASDAAGDGYALQYDPSGNIRRLRRYVFVPGTGGNPDRVEPQEIHYVYGASNRIESITGGLGAFSFGYDASGNLKASHNLTAATYDHHNLPTSLTRRRDGMSLTMGYDEGGNRISKHSNGRTEYYVRGASGEVLAVYEDPGTLLYWNILSGGTPIGRVSISTEQSP